jgi:hypothetical protein
MSVIREPSISLGEPYFWKTYTIHLYAHHTSMPDLGAA